MPPKTKDSFPKVSNNGPKVTATTPNTANGQKTQSRAPQAAQDQQAPIASAAEVCNTPNKNLAQPPEEPKEPQTRQEVIESLPKLKPIAGLEQNIDMVNLSVVPQRLANQLCKALAIDVTTTREEVDKMTTVLWKEIDRICKDPWGTSAHHIPLGRGALTAGFTKDFRNKSDGIYCLRVREDCAELVIDALEPEFTCAKLGSEEDTFQAKIPLSAFPGDVIQQCRIQLDSSPTCPRDSTYPELRFYKIEMPQDKLEALNKTPKGFSLTLGALGTFPFEPIPETIRYETFAFHGATGQDSAKAFLRSDRAATRTQLGYRKDAKSRLRHDPW